MYPPNQLRPTLPCSQRKRFSPPLDAPLGKASQAGRIGTRRLRDADDGLIARHLPLQAELALHPEQYRVQRKDDQAEFLQQVGPIISAAQMLRFVQHDLLQLTLREPVEEPCGNKDARRQKTDDA